MKILKTIFLLSITIFLWACNGSLKNNNYIASEGEYALSEEMSGDINFYAIEEAAEEMAPMTSSPKKPEMSNTSTTKRKLIKTGDIEFETEDLTKTNSKIKKAIKKFGGYIASESEDKYSLKISQKIEIRVPAKNFDKLLKEISKGVKHFDSKNIHVKDVTEEFVDVQARLKTKKELETRYLQLLNKANSVSEILNIEREIGALRADIESFEGRLKYLKDQVSFSTLDVYFYKTLDFEYEHQFGKKIKDGFGNGWENLIYFFIGLINIWPFILIIIVLTYFVRKKIKQRKKNKVKK
jgi:hypothetical protein